MLKIACNSNSGPITYLFISYLFSQIYMDTTSQNSLCYTEASDYLYKDTLVT